MGLWADDEPHFSCGMFWIQKNDQEGAVHCIFLDFPKAFDSVPYTHFFLKLKTYGIYGQLLGWIEKFLLNKRHLVVINGSDSDGEYVTSGIPHESVLGPLLVVIYIYDFSYAIKSQM